MPGTRSIVAWKVHFSRAFPGDSNQAIWGGAATFEQIRRSATQLTAEGAVSTW